MPKWSAWRKPLLPPGARVIPLAEAATLDESSRDLQFTFGIAVIVVLLVLAAQFESFVSALIIMATVPLGLACAVFAMLFTGTSLNVYSQIGLVLLVGVMAKNGILIVEFANQLRNRGRSVREAIEEAANIRLRPVMMTMISTILGAVPLILSFGAGAEARSALGWVIVGGLGLATLATLFLTPVAYLLLARLSKTERRRRGAAAPRALRIVSSSSRLSGSPANPNCRSEKPLACRADPVWQVIAYHSSENAPLGKVMGGAINTPSIPDAAFFLL